MPELPEVETIRRQLAPLVEGRVIERVEVLDPRWTRPLAPRELERALTGRRIERLSRRGKYLLWELDGEVYLAQHLRMTGSILVDPDPEPAHTRVRMLLGRAPRRSSRSGSRARASASRARTRAASSGSGGGGSLRLAISDPRRFGTGELLLGDEARELFFAARLGLEPLDERFTTEHLRTLARGRSAPIKALLLDQRRVAGVGNIYADEALFRARIHPLRAAGSLTTAQLEQLRDGVVGALSAGIDASGASIDDFRHVDGLRGSFQDEFLVHRRAGEPCPRCGGTIVKITAAGRGTYVCERCQRPPRRRGPRRSAARAASGR
jgi:formamidopyrimidine-DNA glycosylase